MTSLIRHALAALAVIGPLLTPPLHAIPGQPGTLDTTWATSSPVGPGKVITPIGSSGDLARAIALQPDGKVLLAGVCSNGTNDDFCLARYNANGTLDTTLNGTGKVITPIGSSTDVANAIALQPDGKVLLAGYCAFNVFNFCAARYNANGTLDTTWNSTGTVITAIGSSDDRATAIALQPDGKMLLAGLCFNGTNYDFCAARYNTNGTLDITWNSTGTVITPIGSSDDKAGAIALQPDGKVLLAGECIGGTNIDFCAARYNTNGTLDTTWNSTGKVITPIGSGNDFATAMTLQPDGKVLLAGQCVNGTSFDFCAARYNANSTLDTTWNSTGKVITPIGSGADNAYAIALQPDGRVLLAGYCGINPNLDFCTARYNANGTLDTTWNSTGTVITAIGSGGDTATAIALQPDGKVLLAGYCIGTNYGFCAARYTANGTLDTTWNGTGTVITPIGGSNDLANAIALQPDGKVLLAGQCFNGTNNDFCTARYNANGTLDTTWNGTGKVITPIVGSVSDVATAIAMQPDGKVLLAGQCFTGTNNDFCAARYNANGTLDTSWGGTGKVITPIGSGGDQATAIALQPDGKVLLAGYCSNGVNDDFCVARYDGGPFGYRNCTPDLDGDGVFLATTDVLIYARVALGITGPAVVNGITFSANATRNTWPLIRDYLVTQCGMSLVQ
jgi:uncharacterized delta-60 repeat protein